MLKTDAPFQKRISNVCYELLISYIMIRNLEFNFLKFLTNEKIEIEAGENENMDALSGTQTNIENKVIEQHNGNLTSLLLTVCNGKYVLYFNNT